MRNCNRIVRRRAPSALRVPISFVRSFTLTNVIFMMPIAPTKSERPVMNNPATAIEFFTGSSVLLNACCSLIEKSSDFSGAKPRTRRIKPVNSSFASASLVLSFTFTRTSESGLAEKYLLNAPSGIATIESQLNKPRNVPCRVFTPTTLKS